MFSTVSFQPRRLAGLRRLSSVVAALLVALALAASAAYAQAPAPAQDAGPSASPAPAALSTDGTSNTIQFLAGSVAIDQAHHRAIVTAPAVSGHTPGMRFGVVRVITSQARYTFENVMVESVAATSTSIAINFTQINVNQ